MRETKQKRPNFYLLLELPYEPPVEDEAEIKAAISKKVSEWRRNTNHPKLQQQVKYYLSLRDQIEAVMLNDAQMRKQEAVDARTQVDAEKNRAKKERETNLDRAIKILTSQGYVSDVAIEALAEKFEFTVAEVESKIPAGSRMKTENQYQDVNPKAVVKSLDSSVMNKITDLLTKLEVNSRHGKVATLYDFLNMTEDTSGATLVDLSEKMYRELLRKPAGNASVEYQKDLYGLVKTLFKSEEERQKYDESLSQHRFNQMKLFIDLAAEQGVISEPVFKQLVIQANEEGLSQTEAENRIREYCVDKKYQLQLHINTAEQASINKFTSCGYCGSINEEKSKCCVNCGHDLEQECIVCQTTSPTSVNNCRNCGTSFKQMLHFKSLMKDGLHSIQMEDLDQASQLLTRAQLIFDNDEVKAGIELINQKKQRILKQIAVVQELIDTRRIYSAELEWNLLKKLAPELDEHTVFQREIASSLQELDQMRIEVQRIADDKQKIAYLLRALGISEDCKWAMEKLEMLPPNPPEGVRAETAGNQIKLTWTLNEPEGFVQFKVIRKEKTAPGFLDDGEFLGETTKPFFTDNTTVPGKSYWYAIFAMRGLLIANKPVLRGPFLRIAEIDSLQGKPVGEAIQLTWKDPGPLTLEVWRKEGTSPSKPGDGKLIKGVTNHSLLDEEVTVGQKYGYTVFTRLLDERGVPSYSKGVSVEVFMIDGEPVNDLHFSLMENTVEFHWTEPVKGSVDLYGSPNPIPFKQGECYSLSAIAQQVKPLSLGTEELGYRSIKDTFPDVFYILPVTKIDGYGIAGKACVIKKIPSVANVKAQLLQTQCLLEWTWPQGIEEVIVFYSEAGFQTKPNREDESPMVYSKSQYDANRGLMLSIGVDKDLFVTIFSYQTDEGTSHYSEGVHLFQTTKKPPKMIYKVVTSGVFSKKVRLNLTLDERQMSLPELVIVKKMGSQPLNVKDGQIIYKIGPDILERNVNGGISLNDRNGEAMVINDGAISFDLTSHRGKNTYVRVFFVNGDDATKFKLEPLGRMELG
ncbi:zinc ribbon domain-containing protein [Litchfieldia alkalitelluris]|uniref:zinc ribbon domain-containing protein n=1 Tax=Litchfieldia alkalitelluris TaxID=304268 RepID=UPI000998803E|nr:zinc ribbon domain-containing protein [Litchfieldia alkalitelluris]